MCAVDSYWNFNDNHGHVIKTKHTENFGESENP